MTAMKMKKQKLRNNEYYNTQEIFDDLYNKAKNKNNYKFNKLMELVISEENIKLAYRNIKKNTGSNTCGTDGLTIQDFATFDSDEVVKFVRNRLLDYKPGAVKRVYIPKENGKTRPLGIPTMGDRIIQQCIKQVLEPICEAKFYSHSYGFRPNRSTHHAISRCYHMIHQNKLFYVVDVDIKGFFDNVDHSKLLKQIWSLGIQDKRLISIISKMLKAPIEGEEGNTTKGTPQGGILSPLLSNIVLNELDWWVAKQWDEFKTEHNYDTFRNGRLIKVNKFRALKNTNLKEMYIVRYADDFKIFCRDYKTANIMYHATKDWLKERLKLDISEEKSKVINLKTDYSDYLGIKFRAVRKGNKLVARSHLNDKAINKVTTQLKEQMKLMSRENKVNVVNNYNAKVLGMQTYYRIATHVNKDFAKINYKLTRTLHNNTRRISSSKGESSKLYDRMYGQYNFKKIYVKGRCLYPIAGVTTSPPKNFTQEINNYTKQGREYIHINQKCVSPKILNYMVANPIPNRSIEYNDNRISLYVAQKGICAITKEPLNINNMECHHKKSLKNGGDDRYSNLILVCREVHKLIHCTSEELINSYLDKINASKDMITKINKLRIQAGNYMI